MIIGFKNYILMISQLINNEGHLFTYITFFESFGIPISKREYSIVFDAIPAGLFRLLQGSSEPYFNVSFKKEILINGIEINNKRCNYIFFRRLVCCPVTPRSIFLGSEQFENIQLKLIWTYNNIYCINNKVNEVYFKIIHTIYATN